MTDTTAPARTTGGAGFNFEDKVAAFFLATMLAGTCRFGIDFGAVFRVEWQVGGGGWKLDDLLVTSMSPRASSLAISIKSNRQVRRSGFPRSFVDAIRAQIDGADQNTNLQEVAILYCLAVGQLADEVRESWHTLSREGRLGEPATIAARYTSAGESNAITRGLFRSLAGKDETPGPETVQLLRQVRLFYFDFTEQESRHEAESIEMCQRALVSGSAEEAIRLWRRLIDISAERRAVGGAIDIGTLIGALRPEYQLKGRIDHSADWTVLDRRSTEVVDSVRDSIGDRVSLVRRQVLDRVSSHVHDGQSVLIAGDGGSGKSSIAKRLAQPGPTFDRFLWLDAAALDFDSLADVERNLGIGTPLQDLVSTSTKARSCIVFDGLEVFSQRAIARASTLLQRLGSNPSIFGWTVIATTRPQAVESAHRLFTRAGIESSRVGVVYVKPPTDQECAEILRTCPTLNSSLIHRELRSSLKNLKLLDWLVSESDSFGASEVQSWAGTTQIITALWNRWVGSDAACAVRAGVMKRLGRLEGEGLLRGVGISELGAAEQGVLQQLETRDLLAVADERVWFRHDSLGDWARLRILIEESPRSDTLAEYARLPRWHDAIRLYGQRLLESDASAPALWTEVLTSLDGESPNVVAAKDMLVEALFCTPDTHALLERAWPALVQHKGSLLRRMLNRFQYAATIPDPRLTSAHSVGADRIEFEVHWRFPWWPLWPGVLVALAAHTDDVARLCPIEAAEVCGLWLRTMPSGTIARSEAGNVALSIGREIQAARGEGLRFRDHADTSAFEAVLHAAPEQPDEVAALCLELSRRRPDPPEVIARAMAHQERVTKELAERQLRNSQPIRAARGVEPLFEPGELRPQFPDGPAENVDEGVQRAVFETQGIISLASVRPDEVREILLACSLEPPRYVRQDDTMSILDRFGLEEPENMFPPMFFRGPWLHLLRHDSSLGVDCIVRLVNHATTQWEQHWLPSNASAEQRATSRTSITINGHPTTWVGNMRIYGWHRERFCSSHLLCSALMALERFLHELLDQDKSIDRVVSQVLADGRSVALLAVLMSIAKYRPQLLSGCLRPLLGGWQLYGWDLQLVLDESSCRMFLFQWARSGERIFNMVRDWQTMPHRTQLFRDLAVAQMLADPHVRDEFGASREEWSTQLESGECVDPEGLELLIARYDPGNYDLVRRQDGAVEAVLTWPKSLRVRAEERARRAHEGARVIMFPSECRKLIENGEPLSDDDAQDIWDQVQKFASMSLEAEGDDVHVNRRMDAVIGGIAVLLTLAAKWISGSDDRVEWCRDQIEAIVRDPPRQSEFEVEGSVSTDRWHSFLAEIAIASFADASGESSARQLAADAVMSFWYATTGVALTAAYRRRDDLGDDFIRLINLGVLWSALRTTLRRHHQHSEAEMERFNARIGRLQSAFVARRIPSTMLDWSAIADIACRAQDRAHLARYPEYRGPTTPKRRAGDTPTIRLSRRNRITRYGPGFDIEALRHAFVWVPNPAGMDATDVAQSVAWLEQLLDVTLRMLPVGSEADGDIEGTPYGYDSWVLNRAAIFAAQLESGDIARSLWQPILDLGPPAHYWVESFIDYWTVHSLKEAPSPARFFERWRDMIRYAIASPVWMPPNSGAFRLVDLWEHLLGMHIGAPIVAADGNQAEFAKMTDLFRTWADRYLHSAHTLRAFLHLLLQDGARPLLCPAVPWLLRAARCLHDLEWGRDQIADDLSKVLSLAWTWHPETIASNKALLADFFELLNILVTQQSRSAMCLRDVVARSAGVPRGW